MSAEPFVTPPGPLTNLMQEAITRVTGIAPKLSTSGGTSDARFITKLCPVAEFGLIGQTMHKVDENVLTDDIDQLTAIYHAMLSQFFKDGAMCMSKISHNMHCYTQSPFMQRY